MKRRELIPILKQFIKFGLVGVSNTIISYALDMFGFYLLFSNLPWSENFRILVTSAIAFFISVTNSYYWNNRYTFGDGTRKTWKEHLKVYFRVVICYGMTGLIFSPIFKMVMNGAGIPYWIAGGATLIVTVPLNFLLNKMWAFRNKITK